jgi:hypothetical protein
MNDVDIFALMSTDNEFASPPRRELRVLSGLHKGAALILPVATITIGSDSNCTVVLLDEGVKPLQLTLQWIKEKGWVQADTPDIQLSGPLLAGPVWICVASPEAPWTELDFLRAEDFHHTPQNPISATPQPAGFRKGNFSNRMRPWALRSVCIASALLLLIAVMGLYTDESISMDSATGKAQTNAVAYKASQQPAALVLQNPLPENPNKDVMAVVSGMSGFVLMRDGQRVYAGEAFGDFVLMDVQSGVPMWRTKLYPPAEE